MKPFRSSEKQWLWLLLPLFTGCVSHNPKWELPKGPVVHEASDLIVYKHSREVASLLALPGDMLLMHIGHSELGIALSQLAVIPASATDLLDFQDPITTYLHSEVVTNITEKGVLKTQSYYPLVKQFKQQQYRGYYSIYRIKDPALQSRALEKVAHATYLPLGYCGDFVAWAYDNQIYSGWNRLPVIQPILGALYPPSAIHTPDSLAQSPETELICEVRGGEIIYPRAVIASRIRDEARKWVDAPRPQIAAHAKRMLVRLSAYPEHAVLNFQKIR